jgi:hypothetical protein
LGFARRLEVGGALVTGGNRPLGDRRDFDRHRFGLLVRAFLVAFAGFGGGAFAVGRVAFGLATAATTGERQGDREGQRGAGTGQQGGA